MKDRLKIVAEKRNVRVLLDNQILFEKIGFEWWKYVHKIKGQLTYEHFQKFNENYFNIFIDDIIEQLENGTNRNDLIINIPKRKDNIIIGNKNLVK
jgi:hypothetical protein